MPALKTQAALAAALAAAAAAWCARLARRRGCTLSEWVGVHAGIASLAVKHETEAQEAVPLGPRRRLRRFRQLAFLLAIERNRRFEVAEAAKCADPDAIYKLHPLQHVKTQGSRRAIGLRVAFDSP
ncbi:hypothetical protein M885DRAFT_500365 [Pelagophyceae sp. CCMP2097]|nr:hypothetical protein M885DRAFT_500365 [Pelagophyceae sp. CCMP2097]